MSGTLTVISLALQSACPGSGWDEALFLPVDKRWGRVTPLVTL